MHLEQVFTAVLLTSITCFYLFILVLLSHKSYYQSYTKYKTNPSDCISLFTIYETRQQTCISERTGAKNLKDNIFSKVQHYSFTIQHSPVLQ